MAGLVAHAPHEVDMLGADAALVEVSDVAVGAAHAEHVLAVIGQEGGGRRCSGQSFQRLASQLAHGEGGILLGRGAQRGDQLLPTGVGAVGAAQQVGSLAHGRPTGGHFAPLAVGRSLLRSAYPGPWGISFVRAPEGEKKRAIPRPGDTNRSFQAPPAGFEPATCGLEVRRSLL